MNKVAYLITLYCVFLCGCRSLPSRDLIHERGMDSQIEAYLKLGSKWISVPELTKASEEFIRKTEVGVDLGKCSVSVWAICNDDQGRVQVFFDPGFGQQGWLVFWGRDGKIERHYKGVVSE